MSEGYFNEDQQSHMKYLATIPRDQRCGSGWHVLARESCNCGDYIPCIVDGCLRNRHPDSKYYCYKHARSIRQ